MPEPEQIQMLARPKSIEQLRQLQRDLFELSKPFVRAKCDVLATSLPTYRYWPGTGEFEIIHDVQTLIDLARIDQVWTEARNHFCTVNGLDLPEPKDTDNG